MENFKIDYDTYPIIEFKLIGTLTVEDVEGFMKLQDQILTLNKKFASIVDLSEMEHISSTQRKTQADWEKKNHDYLNTYCVGSAFIVPSTFMRGAMMAISWLHEWPNPYKYVSSRAEAEQFIDQKLKEHGLSK